MVTVVDKFVNEIVIQKSRFIAVLVPLENKEQAKDILVSLNKEYPKATHYCYAYIVDGVNKSNDDGEPASTAGRPILEVMLKNDLNRAMIVVIRYFGGIKLGAGGLTRAYVESAVGVLAKAKLYEKRLSKVYSVKISYSLFDITKNYFNKQNVEILDIKYEDNIELIVSSLSFDEEGLISYLQNKLVLTFLEEREVLIEHKEDK